MTKHLAVASWVVSVRGYEVRMAEEEGLRPRSYHLSPLLQKEGLLSSLWRPLHRSLSTPTGQHLFTAPLNVHSRECTQSLINHLLSASKVAVLKYFNRLCKGYFTAKTLQRSVISFWFPLGFWDSGVPIIQY